MFTLLDGFNLGLGVTFGIMVFVALVLGASIVLALGFKVVVWLLKKLIGVIIFALQADSRPAAECRTKGLNTHEAYRIICKKWF